MAIIDVIGEEIEVNNFAKAKQEEEAELVIRPEGASPAEHGLLEVMATLSTFMGAYRYYQVMEGDMEVQITDYNPVNRRIYEVGEKAYLDFDPKGVYIVQAGSGGGTEMLNWKSSRFYGLCFLMHVRRSRIFTSFTLGMFRLTTAALQRQTGFLAKQ